MSTKNGTVLPSNGVSRSLKEDKAQLLIDKRNYNSLQKAIGYQIKIIDKLLQQYYSQNKYIPKGTQLLKWNIVKDKENRNAPTVEVYINTQKTGRTLKKTVAALQTMNALSVMSNSMPLTDSNDGESDPNVLTYNLIGAPPSGPTPAKPQ